MSREGEPRPAARCLSHHSSRVAWFNMDKGNMPPEPPATLRRDESNGSFASARDSKFWLAVASASASAGASFSSGSASSRSGSFVRRGDSVLELKDANGRSLCIPRRLSRGVSTADLGLAIDVDDDDDLDGDDGDENSDQRCAPITSPPAPSARLNKPTILQSHRYRDRLGSEWRASAASANTNDRSDAKVAPAARAEINQVQSSLHQVAEEAHTFEIGVEEVYEHQRYQRLLGWGSKGHLLPMDPGKYVRVVRIPERPSGPRKRRPSLTFFQNDGFQAFPSPTFPDVPLPEPPSDRFKWEWISPWHLDERGATSVAGSDTTDEDTPVDPDGWIYASGFSQFTSWRNDSTDSLDSGVQNDNVCANPKINARGRPKFNARRRKWIRYRRLRSVSEECANDLQAKASPFDDSFLDSMCGWLRKLGHVRKNWKMRYFVLEKSVLRYYADEEMTKLKGEVLLFHPAAQVHYVDIHLSKGRENTFAIQVGPEYTLMLEADRVSDRENWMYCIEDALLCRDSYLQDPARTQDVRESVARRRNFSSETILYSTNGESSSGINPINMLILHSKAVIQATRKNPLMMRLMVECDAFLESKHIKQQISTFVDKFKHKYGCGGPSRKSGSQLSKTTSPVATTKGCRHRTPSYDGVNLRDSDVSVSQHPRSLLALKNYRFFLERTMTEVMDHLTKLPLANATCNVTSPKSAVFSSDGRVSTSSSTYSSENPAGCESPSASSDIDWELAKKAALYKLERQTFIPLQDIIYNLLESLVGSDDFDRFERNRRFLSKQTQSFFEIQQSQQSVTEWKSARALLDSMDNYSLPSEKASILLEVAKCIYDTYAMEHAVDVQMMAADDFLPIFIFVLARSKLRNVVVARHLISETMISCVMIGETGYYATMFEAAISYIASFLVSDENDVNASRISESRTS